MSYSTLYRVYRTCARPLAEYPNGWGTAPVIWGYLCEQYLGREHHQWGWDDAEKQQLWDLVIDPRVPRAYRLVHAFTFDWTVCPPERACELADACDEVFRGTRALRPDYVNHWSTIAKDLREHKRLAREIGVALNCTSVGDIWHDWRAGRKWSDTFACVDNEVNS